MILGLFLPIKCDIGIFADDTRTVHRILTELDAEDLQADLDMLYEWADDNNMAFNGLKFEVLKYGNNDVKYNYDYTNPGATDNIEEKDTLRDLGIQMSNNGKYDEHITYVVRKAKKKAAWIRRSFIRNDISFRRKLWRTYIEGAMDYGSQLWSPIESSKLSYLESVLRGYLASTKGLDLYSHWERLKICNLQSIQRRHEGYKVMYI